MESKEGKTRGASRVPVDSSDVTTRDLAPASGDDDALSDEWGRRLEAAVRKRLLERGPARESIGRYAILERLGQGGMGTVYAAYDDQLDRKIAVKLLHRHELPTEAQQLRFQREAQALARLSHPNVVTVHEVGRAGDELFLALEHVRGQSFDDWLRTEPPWPEILQAFIEAGRGLAAAHSAGLVHRDVKPSNFMRSDDGFVKVLDFGLARAVGESVIVNVNPLTSSSSSLHTDLTMPGTIMGTPLYMSPEQLAGDEVDPRSDQYGFCVALWQGLTRTRPFDVDDFEQMLDQKLSGPPPWPDDAAPVPRRIIEALRRGLAPEPDDRWPSLPLLLDALSFDPRRRRNRWILAAAGVGGAGLLAVSATSPSAVSPPAPCHGAERNLEGVWDPTRRAEVQAAFAAVDEPYAERAWQRSQQELDRHAEKWVAMHTEACEATTVRGEQSPQMLDLRMACLHRALQGLEATVDTLHDADAKVVQNAHELTADLPSLDRCADTEALATDVEPPPSKHAEVVDRAWMEIARSRSLEHAGRYDDANRALALARDALDGVDYGPIETELAFQEGSVLESLGKYDEAEAALKRALRLGMRWNQRSMMAATLRKLMFVVGYRKNQVDEGLRYRPLLQGLFEDQPETRAFDRALLGMFRRTQGRFEEAETEYRAALALSEEHEGPLSDQAATIRHNLSVVLGELGKYEDAEAQIRKSIAIREGILGPTHPGVTAPRHELANSFLRTNRYAEAEAEFRLVLDHWLVTLGPGHPDVGMARSNLAGALASQDRLEEAGQELRQAIEIWSKTYDPSHPQVLTGRHNLAITLSIQGRHEAAEAELISTLPLWEETVGPDHLTVARVRYDIAESMVGRGAMDDALPFAERAWARRSKDGVPEHLRASTAFVLAQILWASEPPARDRARARALAEDALTHFRAAEAPHSDQGLEVERWLEAHPAG